MQMLKTMALKSYCKMSSVLTSLKNRKADENTAKIIWILVVFLVGAALIALFVGVMNGTVATWWNNTFSNWFPAAGVPAP